MFSFTGALHCYSCILIVMGCACQLVIKEDDDDDYDYGPRVRVISPVDYKGIPVYLYRYR